MTRKRALELARALFGSEDQKTVLLNYSKKRAAPFPVPCSEHNMVVVATAILRAVQEEREAKDAAYTERDRLVCALSKLYPSHLMQHPAADTVWENDWRTIVCIHGPTGQMTWHIHDREIPWFAHLRTELSDAELNDWDGHTTEEKYHRLEAIR